MDTRETPMASAIARPVQRVTAPGGSVQVSATIRATTEAGMGEAGQPGRFGVGDRPRRLDDLALADRLLPLFRDANAKRPDASAPRKSGYPGHLLVAPCSAVV